MNTTTNTPVVRHENIAHEAIQILKTVALLEQNYSSSYLVRILQADERYKFRKINHQELETYGALEDVAFSRLEDVIHYLATQGMLQVTNPLYGTVDLTDKGREFLAKPYDIEVPRSELYRGWAQIQLSIGLRTLRREYAAKTNQPPYQLFTNYVLDTLARQMPTTPAELDQVPAMKNLGETLRQEILEEIQRIKELQAQNEASEGAIAKAYSPGHRKIKELFEAQFSIPEIARRRNLQQTTVRSYLADLYEAGQLNLQAWIEREVDAQELHKGVEYFRSAQTPSINEAKQVLDYDYDLLRLCRAYAHQAQEPEPVYAT